MFMSRAMYRLHYYVLSINKGKSVVRKIQNSWRMKMRLKTLELAQPLPDFQDDLVAFVNFALYCIIELEWACLFAFNSLYWFSPKFHKKRNRLEAVEICITRNILKTHYLQCNVNTFWYVLKDGNRLCIFNFIPRLEFCDFT
jgi:hypothetical protein